MNLLRIAFAAGISAVALTAAAPASAQFFFKSKDFSGPPIRGDEPDIGQVLPGATDVERRAAVVWKMRAALNVAALQCQFEPTLLTVAHYNAILRDHDAELTGSFATLTKYFVRTAKTKAAGQTALDQFGTRTYSSFATVAAQYGFCQTAAAIGRDEVFTPRGHFGDVALQRLRELRNSLVPAGEQQFARYLTQDRASYPRLDAICWSNKGEWQAKKCGPMNWPPAGNVVATR